MAVIYLGRTLLTRRPYPTDWLLRRRQGKIPTVSSLPPAEHTFDVSSSGFEGCRDSCCFKIACALSCARWRSLSLVLLTRARQRRGVSRHKGRQILCSRLPTGQADYYRAIPSATFSLSQYSDTICNVSGCLMGEVPTNAHADTVMGRCRSNGINLVVVDTGAGG